MGNFFEALRVWLRDQPRDDLCESLRALGLPARLAPRGASEETMLGGVSLGLVTICHGPIPWVNVRKESEGEEAFYYTDLAAPDPRLRDGLVSGLEIVCVTNRGPWDPRQPTKLWWRGNDLGLGILGRLNGDDSLREPLLGRRYAWRGVTIRARDRHRFWTITVPGGDTTVIFPFAVYWPKLDYPSIDQWRCYQAIAQHLLDTPLDM